MAVCVYLISVTWSKSEFQKGRFHLIISVVKRKPYLYEKSCYRVKAWNQERDSAGGVCVCVCACAPPA